MDAVALVGSVFAARVRIFAACSRCPVEAAMRPRK
jgi:hypothetical protein